MPGLGLGGRREDGLWQSRGFDQSGRQGMTADGTFLLVFPPAGAGQITADGEEYLILREDDVLGVVETTAKGKSAK